eukprot:gene12590-16883_t
MQLSIIALAFSVIYLNQKVTSFQNPLLTIHNNFNYPNTAPLITTSPWLHVNFKQTHSILQANDKESADEDIQIMQSALTLTLITQAKEIFNIASNKDNQRNGLTKETILLWERKLDSISSELRQLTNKKILLSTYENIIKLAAPLELDPLQLATFEVISFSIADTLVKLIPKNQPVTELIDEITDIHLSYIEEFRNVIDDGGDEGYSQSSRQEYLTYQFAGLVRKMYDRLSKSLGADFDSSSLTQDMRLNNWVAPVNARLQRRFVRFVASNVEEKLDEIYGLAFDQLLDKLSLSSTIKYTLSGLLVNNDVQDVTQSEDTKGMIVNYPPWQITNILMKIFRNTANFVNLDSLEFKVARTFRNDLSNRIRLISKNLEKIYEKRFGGDNGGLFLSDNDTKSIEDMINLGHECAAAVLTIWHIRYNIVGTLDKSTATSTNRIKDFIKPVDLMSVEAALSSIPKKLRDEVGFIVLELKERLKPSLPLEAIAVMGHALRITANEEFRSLIMFNADSSEWPADRDSVYVTALSSILIELLTALTFDQKWLNENLLSMVVLEETLGTREPRAACAEAYEAALSLSVLQLLANKAAVPTDLSYRVKEIERALGMVLRLPEGSGKVNRVKAFKDCINQIIRKNELENKTGLKEVMNEYVWIANMLFIDPNLAKNYVEPLGKTKFDKAVGDLLMNTDLTMSLPSLGDIFEEQILVLANDLLIPAEEALLRIELLSGVVFTSFIELALEEHKKMNYVRADKTLRRASQLFKHPLLVKIQSKRNNGSNKNNQQKYEEEEADMMSIGQKMIVSRLGVGSIMDLIRFVDEANKMVQNELNDSKSSSSSEISTQ